MGLRGPDVLAPRATLKRRRQATDAKTLGSVLREGVGEEAGQSRRPLSSSPCAPFIALSALGAILSDLNQTIAWQRRTSFACGVT